MKTDPTTKLLLGVIATGVAALTALAFEKRYHRQLRPLLNDLDDATGHTCDRLSQKTRQAGRAVQEEAGHLRDRFEDGVDTLREKAGDLKDRVSDTFERVGSQLRDGAGKLREGFKNAANEAKDGVENAAEEIKRPHQA